MDLSVTQRTLLAPSVDEGKAMAREAFAMVEAMGVTALPLLVEKYQAEVVLHWGEKPRFHREEFFNTGGTRVDIWHPSLPKPVGLCDHGKFHAGGRCGADAFFRIPEGAKKNYAHPTKMIFLCPKHKAGQLV